ncbi:putative phosphoesterase (MutT family) [Thermaerobacter subterraneus DSM 13965]|uniref:Phosphoesterase (MutT family) n=2 Tax=Thermaerobacter TaxID=73918 RepID=K6QCX1_9FIRM|nr:putative phosphoesterase (MutT family) [Thermaerobacter subterraneus DSM 13965]
MGKMDEQIVVVPRRVLFGEREIYAFQGLLTDPDDVRVVLMNMTMDARLMRRGDAEENPAYKQPIPYVVLRQKGTGKIYVYERLSGSGETRLHNKLSIGVGGHMQKLFDSETFGSVLAGETMRELTEELLLRRPDGTEIVFGHGHMPVEDRGVMALINDDINGVGRVHIGLLTLLELDESIQVEVREKDQLRGFWTDVSELTKPQFYARLESWSQFAIDYLKEEDVSA